MAQELIHSSEVSAELVQRTNSIRGSFGLNSLSESGLLDVVARQKAQSMADGSYFSHVSPGGKGPWRWLIDIGYGYEEAGENLAVSYVDDWDIVDAWMNSPSHRENVLRASFDEMGVGQASGVYKGRPAVFTVEFLAKRKKVR